MAVDEDSDDDHEAQEASRTLGWLHFYGVSAKRLTGTVLFHFLSYLGSGVVGLETYNSWIFLRPDRRQDLQELPSVAGSL